MLFYTKKLCWLLSAVLFLVLGLVGIVLPILPQVPFLIISFICLSKFSPKIHHWIRQRHFYQKYILKFEHKFDNLFKNSPKFAWMRHLTHYSK